MPDTSKPTPAAAAGVTIADAGERALIDRIRIRAGAPPSWVAIGIGDDAAVVEPVRGRSDVLTTDTLVEDVHFRKDWTSLHAVGRKAVVVNLSDLAAMGAMPRALLLDLCLPGQLPLSEFDELIAGVTAEGAAAGSPLIGGNISRSPGPLVVTVTALGSVHSRRVLTRSGARPGDELYVTGTVGAAAAGLAALAFQARASLEHDLAACVARYERPTARLRCGRLVAGARAASACMDLSDGLADGVAQIAAASGTGAVVQAELVPIDAGAQRWWSRQHADAVSAAVIGGEDYELLFAVPPKRRRAFLAAVARCPPLPVTRVGQVTPGRDLILLRGEDRLPLPSGYAHFGHNSR